MQAQGISAVVTTWNNAASIRQCLDSVLAAGVDKAVLCDCGSSDDTVQVVCDDYPQVAILSRGCLFNFAQARNLGIRNTTSPLILFLDGDWRADPSSFRKLQHALLSSPDYAVAAPRFKDEDGQIQIGHNVRRFPTTGALCMELLLLHKLLPHNSVTRHYRMMDFAHDQDRVVDHGCGAFILARRQALLETGAYDESYGPAWMEDVDLSQRLARLGWITVFCAAATAQHLGRETTRHFIIENRYDDFYRSVLRYCRTYLTSSRRLVRACMAVGMLARMAFSYLLPQGLRRRLLRHYRIYNSDPAIQSYKQMYLRTLAGVIHKFP